MEMAKGNRVLVDSGYYHIMLKGTGRMIIFEDSRDYLRFLEIMKEVKDEMEFDLIAYCLMSNHIHLLIGDRSNTLSRTIQKVALKYVKYFNYRHDREGHLFRGRYKSEVITSDRQFMVTFRYIMQNPKKAGIADSCNYKWNCYSEYFESGNYGNLIDRELILEMLGGEAELLSFIGEAETEKTTDFETARRITDEEALALVQSIYGKGYNSVIKQMLKEERNEAIRALKNRGLTIKQIERLTGIGRNIVQRA